MPNSWTADGSGEEYKALPSGPTDKQEEEVSARMSGAGILYPVFLINLLLLLLLSD